MRRRLRPGALVVAALAAALAGCDRSKLPGPPPSADLPPSVVAVYPASRTTFVLYDIPEVWAQFAEDLDSTTVSDHTVYLKLDDARLPIDVRWDASSRRIVVSVRQALNLLQTYTVELSPEIRSAAGVRFGRTYFWQFSTNSLRRPMKPVPGHGVVGESPFARLQWSGNETVAQTIRYDVFAGMDSASVATRGAPIAGTTQNTRVLLPLAKWGEDTTVWWGIRATNLATGEVLEGPTWRFTVLGPATALLDSLIPTATDWGWRSRVDRLSGQCGSSEIQAGPNLVNGLRWNLSTVDTTFRAAGVRWTMTSSNASPVPLSSDPTVWAVTRLWSTCTGWFTTPPAVDATGPLAHGEAVGTRTVAFTSDPLAAHLEATIRYGGYFGYSLRSPEQVNWASPSAAGNVGPRPRLVIYRYRPRLAVAP